MKDKDVIIALDFHSRNEVFDFLGRLGTLRPYVKVGMELFYSEGARLVAELKERGHKVFLDLKLHDIPTTVSRSMNVISRMGADMVNLHAAGGSAMMKAALEGLVRPDGTRPLLVAVTVLTSTDAAVLKNELLVGKSVAETVETYAANAAVCGLDGVVCSPLEAENIHAKLGMDFLTVTPGIRFEGADAQDQKRIATPQAAARLGSDFIVVGRPITRADRPDEAYLACRKAFLETARD